MLWLCSAIIASCGVTDFDSPQALQDYVFDPDNGLSQEANVDQYRVTVTYKPTDLLVSQHIDDENVDAVQIEKLRARYSRSYYFILSLSRDSREVLQPVDGGSTNFSAMVETLSFRMGEYVALVTSSRDTIPVQDFVLDRTYGMSKSTDLLFVFDKAAAKDSDWIQFNLDEFGLGLGNHRFRFSKEKLDEVPQLTF
jgi:hypothetical protein